MKVDTLHGDDVFAGQLPDRNETGRHGLIGDVVARWFSDKNSASAAIAFFAPLFGSGELNPTDVIEQKSSGGFVGCDDGIVE